MSKYKKMTLAEIKESNKKIGNHFFDKGTMKFFNSKIETQPNRYYLFITSEKCKQDRPKEYTVRFFNYINSGIVTVSEFRQFHSIESAKEFRDDITSAYDFVHSNENTPLHEYIQHVKKINKEKSYFTGV